MHYNTLNDISKGVIFFWSYFPLFAVSLEVKPAQEDAATIRARAKRSWELFIIKQNLNNLFYFVNLPHNLK